MEVDHTSLFQIYKKEKNLNKMERILTISMHKNKYMHRTLSEYLEDYRIEP